MKCCNFLGPGFCWEYAKNRVNCRPLSQIMYFIIPWVLYDGPWVMLWGWWVVYLGWWVVYFIPRVVYLGRWVIHNKQV